MEYKTPEHEQHEYAADGKPTPLIPAHEGCRSNHHFMIELESHTLNQSLQQQDILCSQFSEENVLRTYWATPHRKGLQGE